VKINNAPKYHALSRVENVELSSSHSKTLASDGHFHALASLGLLPRSREVYLVSVGCGTAWVHWPSARGDERIEPQS
jgi:hypothetical protein